MFDDYDDDNNVNNISNINNNHLYKYCSPKKQLMDMDTLSELIKIIDLQNNKINSLVTELSEVKSKSKIKDPELSYIMEYYRDSPVLEPIKDFSDIDYNRYAEKLKFDVYIGDFIIKNYVKKNPSEQSIWYCDEKNLTFIIRDGIDNDDGIKWKIDKYGIKTTEIIINPILKYLHNKISKNLNKHATDYACTIGYKRDVALTHIDLLSKILKNIDNKIYHKKILRYIAPHFCLVESDAQLLKDDYISIQI